MLHIGSRFVSGRAGLGLLPLPRGMYIPQSGTTGRFRSTVRARSSADRASASEPKSRFESVARALHATSTTSADGGAPPRVAAVLAFGRLEGRELARFLPRRRAPSAAVRIRAFPRPSRMPAYPLARPRSRLIAVAASSRSSSGAGLRRASAPCAGHAAGRRPRRLRARAARRLRSVDRRRRRSASSRRSPSARRRWIRGAPRDHARRARGRAPRLRVDTHAELKTGGSLLGAPIVALVGGTAGDADTPGRRHHPRPPGLDPHPSPPASRAPVRRSPRCARTSRRSSPVPRRRRNARRRRMRGGTFASAVTSPIASGASAARWGRTAARRRAARRARHRARTRRAGAGAGTPCAACSDSPSGTFGRFRRDSALAAQVVAAVATRSRSCARSSSCRPAMRGSPRARRLLVDDSPACSSSMHSSRT